MPTIASGDVQFHYEQAGQGPVLVFVHGAFCDGQMWEPQWRYFAASNRVVRYDLRGHGQTGSSTLKKYRLKTFADDLLYIFNALDIQSAVLCGQSFGGSVAQAFAIENPQRLDGLVLASSMAAIDLTPLDWLLCRVLFPRWAMLCTIRVLSVEDFSRFSLCLGRLAMGRQLLSQDRAITAYLQQCMLQIPRSEYLKLWDAMYHFHLLPLGKISCPVLIMNGQHEPAGMFRHSQVVTRLIQNATTQVIPAARHTANLENPGAFNRGLEEFMRQCT